MLYAANIGVIVLSLALSAIVINVAKQGDKGKPMPKWIDRVGIQGFAIFILILLLCYIVSAFPLI